MKGKVLNLEMLLVLIHNLLCFQRIRELEDKLEAQKRHLKELEEKVGGRARAGHGLLSRRC